MFIGVVLVKNDIIAYFTCSHISRPKTQGVPLDGTIFFCNTGQKDKATFMNKNITIEELY